MRTWIGDKLYDTSTAPLVAEDARDGRMLALHRKTSGEFFFYCRDADGCETVVPTTYGGALRALRAVYGADAEQVLAQSLPKTATVTLRGPSATRLNLAASKTGKSKVEILEELVMQVGSSTEKISASDTDE